MKASLAVRMGMAIVVSFAAAAVSAQAPGPGQGPDGGPGFRDHRPPMERAMRGEHGRWWNDPNIVAKLKLTDDQRKSMDDIFQQHREKLVDLRANLEKAELAMEPLVHADQPNEAAVMSQIDEVAQARAELEKANARFLFALRAKLTPDQWKQVQEFRKNREAMRPQWRHGGGRRGPGQGTGAPDDNAAPAPAPGPQGMLGAGPENF